MEATGRVGRSAAAEWLGDLAHGQSYSASEFARMLATERTIACGVLLAIGGIGHGVFGTLMMSPLIAETTLVGENSTFVAKNHPGPLFRALFSAEQRADECLRIV